MTQREARFRVAVGAALRPGIRAATRTDPTVGHFDAGMMAHRSGRQRALQIGTWIAPGPSGGDSVAKHLTDSLFKPMCGVEISALLDPSKH